VEELKKIEKTRRKEEKRDIKKRGGGRIGEKVGHDEDKGERGRRGCKGEERKEKENGVRGRCGIMRYKIIV
jgi:hypothetical protein